MDIKISKQNYASLLSLIDRAVNIVYSHSPTDREYNVARRLRIIKRQIERTNPLTNR